MAIHGSKHFDPMLGVDFHEYIAPPGVWPTPHISLVLDLFDYLPLIGATVSIHGLRRTTAGTEGLSFHIPIGVPSPSSLDEFLKPEAEVFMGSKTVIADGDPLSRMVVPTLSCNIVGILPPFRPKKAVKTFALTLPLTVNLALPHQVIVGGPLTINWMAMAMKLGFAAISKIAKKVKKSQKFKKGMNKFKEFRQKIFKNMKPGTLKCDILRAEPVDIRDGSVHVVHQDFVLPGRVPLAWNRYYNTADTDDEGVMGNGWRTLVDTRLCLDRDSGVRFLELADGPLLFPDVPAVAGKAAAVYSIPASARLWFEDDAGVTRWYAETQENQFWIFTDERDAPELVPEALEDNNGNGWRFSFARNLLTLTEYTRQGVTGRQLEMPVENRRISHIVLEDTVLEPGSGKYHPRSLATYGYDDENRLVSHTDNAGHSQRYAWLSGNYMRYHADRLGQRFHYDYDDQWRVVHAWGDGGYYDYRFEWNDSSHELVVTDSLGHASILRFSEDRLPLCEIDPEGGVTFYLYDEYGLTTGVTAPGGGTTSWEYDDMGNVCSETAADDSKWTAAWQDNHLTEYCAPDGGKWVFEYDASGNLTAVTDPSGVAQGFQHDPLGQIIRQTYGAGNDVQFTYDRLGFVHCVTHRNGSRDWYEWNNCGSLLSQTNALLQQTRYTVDVCERVTQVMLPDGRYVDITYDAEGQITAYRDEAGRVTRLSYSPTGEVTECIKPDGSRIGYEYDTEDQLTAVCNELGQRWLLRRDGLGRITEERNWRKQSTRYGWNADGWLTSRTTPDGRSLTYQHDRVGRMTALCDDGRLLARYGYDEQGRLTACDNPYRRLAWEYDAAGRLVQEHQDAFTVQHFYSAQGQYAGRESSSGNRVALAYNDAGLISQIQINDGQPVLQEYDMLGRPVREQLAAGLVRERMYNTRGQLTSQDVSKDNVPLFSLEWRYDQQGNIISRHDSIRGETRFEYDMIGQLTACTDVLGRVQRFITDAAGNRLQEEIQRREGGGDDNWVCHAWLAEDWDALEHWYNRNGQLIQRRQRRLVNGFTTQQTDDLTWDELGRLATYRNERLCSEYGYDGLGRRVFKKTTRAGSEVSDIRWFWWDGDTLLAECDEQAQAAEAVTQACAPDEINSELDRHSHLLQLVSGALLQEYVYRPDSFEPLALITAGSMQGNAAGSVVNPPAVYFYHNDINGAPLRITDARGYSAWSLEPGAWGENGQVSEIQVSNPLRFQGQYFDEESGLHYNRYRYYEPESGRYISQDPIGLMGGINVYQYVPNTLSWFDLLGLKCGTIEYRHKQKPNKVTNIRELRRQIRGQVRAFNKILKEEGMSGLKKRINDYNSVLEKEGRDYVRGLGTAGEGKVWLHEPDMRTGGLPSDVSRTGLSRENSIIGGNAPSIARQILDMPDDVTRITSKLFFD
ncbi:type IV secretion protein Rhs [Enterobacteriaceae bacterium 4M9]|nr:type IV secretion protein Rhs [Enterobacteriaceae bacterium 4M9]